MSYEKKMHDACELLKNLDARIKQVANHLMDHARPEAQWTSKAVHKVIVQAIKLHLMDKRKTPTEPFICPLCNHRIEEWPTEAKK